MLHQPPDRLLLEIEKIWEIRNVLRDMSDEEAAKLAEALSDEEADSWSFLARDTQLPPRDWLDTWVINAGRGFGKTRVGSEVCHMAVEAGLRRLHIIAPTAADYRDVNIEGPSGLLATAPAGVKLEWEPSKRKVSWPNGAFALFFSGDEPEALRGPQCEFCWIDELARMRYQQLVYDMAVFGLRLGDRPRMLVTTTPRPTQFFKKLIATKGVLVSGGSTYDNSENLAASFLEKVKEQYEGTTLGQQELHGLMAEVQSDLFQMSWIGRKPIEYTNFKEIAVGVDPSGGGDEIGIVAAGVYHDKRSAVIADRTCKGTPEHWGRQAVKTLDDFGADCIVAESNFGGDMVMSVIQNAAADMFAKQERDSPMVKVKLVTASKGKVIRAEPISLLYEQGRVDHAKNLQKLEAEMSSFTRDWDRKVDGSPNRLDALVWALTKTSTSVKKTLAVA